MVSMHLACRLRYRETRVRLHRMRPRACLMMGPTKISKCETRVILSINSHRLDHVQVLGSRPKLSLLAWQARQSRQMERRLDFDIPIHSRICLLLSDTWMWCFSAISSPFRWVALVVEDLASGSFGCEWNIEFMAPALFLWPFLVFITRPRGQNPAGIPTCYMCHFG